MESLISLSHIFTGDPGDQLDQEPEKSFETTGSVFLLVGYCSYYRILFNMKLGFISRALMG
jgi:hypothetical protein